MALEPASAMRSGSPESSGRDSPIPRQWRNQLSGVDTSSFKDKSLRRYAQNVEKTLALFETTLEEWADYISFLNKVLKTLQGRPSNSTVIPAKAVVAKRLAQCLDPTLPSGVHQKALEVYNYIFEVIGKDGLSRDLPLYLPGLAPTLSFASLSVRSPFLEILETHFVGIDARSLRPAMRSIILALLPGLEDESSEDFDRTLQLVAKFKAAIRPTNSYELTPDHSTGDDFFWQCFFLATITSHSRRSGALAYLIRFLPSLRTDTKSVNPDNQVEKLTSIVTSPEPGLLLRCFASGLSDDQLLIQRGFLDLLVTHLPLNSDVLQSSVKPDDFELLLKAATGVVIRRDMSLNRRLWAWLLGPEPTGPDGDIVHDVSALPSDQQQIYLASRTNFFEEYGLSALVKALLDMIKESETGDAVMRARPYRICLSLMDRWEIGGLVVPEIFLPVIQSVEGYEVEAASEAEFKEVLRSASVFFDGIESGLIYSELVGLLAQAIGPGSADTAERLEKLSLINFVISNFNVREEEMVTIHAPHMCLAALYMLEDSRERRPKSESSALDNEVFTIVMTLLDLIPERAFPAQAAPESPLVLSNVELLKRIRDFYVNEQGNLDSTSAPFTQAQVGELLLNKAAKSITDMGSTADIALRVKVLLLAITRIDKTYSLDTVSLLKHMDQVLSTSTTLQFADFSSMLLLAVQLYYVGRISINEVARLTPPLVHHAWVYLSASEPKYHVETVRCLWQLQSALTVERRDVEAALSTIIVKESATENGDVGKVFGVLWSHTLQDNPSERRGSRDQLSDAKGHMKLAGADYYEVMLSQPLFLILDTLLDDRTKAYMTVKAWLNSMVGIDRMFLLLATRFQTLSFLFVLFDFDKEKVYQANVHSFTDEDDTELGLYHLRTLGHILQCIGAAGWAVLSSKHIVQYGRRLHISGGDKNSVSLQEYFTRVCMAGITGSTPSETGPELRDRACQLQRYSLNVLRQFLGSPWAGSLAKLHLENVLVNSLWLSLDGKDSYMQVLLLDAVHDTIRLQETTLPETSTSPVVSEQRLSTEKVAHSLPSAPSHDNQPLPLQLPAQLLKCLQAGLSAPSSQAVLDSWVVFLGECLPLYASSIFQILIPLVESLCKQINITFAGLSDTFEQSHTQTRASIEAPESTLIYLLNGLEQVLARAHEQLLADEARAELNKGPEQPQSLFGSISGVFQSDAPQSRSATANDRLTVYLAFQDAVRICYKIWSWGQGESSARQDVRSLSSFNYTSLRMRNRARRLLEQLFAAETLECLETVIDIWHGSDIQAQWLLCFDFLSALDASRPRQTIPSLFNSIYSRTNPTALDPARKSAMTVSLADTDLAIFLVQYARRLDDDAMDEIWADCITFLKDILANPLPHRQVLPSLLEFAAILGDKVDNTNFGDLRKMRRELGDLFLRLVAALFTTRPMAFADATSDKSGKFKSGPGPAANAEDVIGVLASVIPNLHKVLPEHDRVLSAAGTISTNVVGPMLKSKMFPDCVSPSCMKLLQELSKLQNNQKSWKKDVGDAFNDSRFFGMRLSLVTNDWLPLLKQWVFADKEKLPEIVSRITAPATAGIVFGVGATSARLDADRKTQLNLRRVATLVLACDEDAFVADLPFIFSKLVELLGANSTSSPSSATRADIYMLVRAIVLRTSAVQLSMLWPVINAEIHAAISSVVAPDNSAASETYTNASVLQACKLLDLLVCLAPDDFQLHEWLFITDSIDAIYRSASAQPVALADEISEDLGSAAYTAAGAAFDNNVSAKVSGPRRRLLLGPGGISDDVSLDRRDELVAKVLRPFFGQLSIFAFESTYAMGAPDTTTYANGLLKDLFDEQTMVRQL